MIIYNSVVKGFKDDIFNGSLIEKLDDLVTAQYRRSSASEVNAWRNSLMYMNTILSNVGIPDNTGVAIEYMIPSTSKRIDFILSGYDSRDKASVVIIELKQWSTVEDADDENDLVQTYLGGGLRKVPHPSYQAWSYAALLRDFNESVEEGNIGLHPCAYLHNYRKQPNDILTQGKFTQLTTEAPLFDQRENRDLCDFIERHIRTGDSGQLIYEIDHGRIRPSQSLQDRIAGMLRGNKEFTMVDDQKVVYEKVIAMAEKTRQDSRKRVLIVEGGPGTGKSVVAVNLLGELTNRSFVTQYISKNSAPRNVYKTKLKGSMKISSIDNLFKGPGIYHNSPENDIDVAIVDEAHRLNAQSGFYGNVGENQIKEIISASSCSVFFVDDHQRVTFKDIGSKDEILKQAWAQGVLVDTEVLASQFRCNGSDGYLAWIDDVLQVRETANPLFDIDYDFDVVDTPQELAAWVQQMNGNNKSRIIAGYCWEWPTEERKNTEFHDIRIEEHDYGISWNLNQGIWAIDPDSVSEAGCIHTSQGLEFEYVGIIIGPDMVYEAGEVKTDVDARARSDQSIKGLKKLGRTDPDEAARIGDAIVRNTYRTLLTRGMKGCRVFCTDRRLAEYLKQRRSADDLFTLTYPEAARSYLEVAEREE